MWYVASAFVLVAVFLLRRIASDNTGESVSLSPRDAAIQNAAREYGIAPELLFAIGWKESKLVLHSRGALDELGPFQMRPATFADVHEGNPSLMLTSWVVASNSAAAYVVWLLERPGVDGDTTKMLQAYNGGIGKLQNGRVPPAAIRYATDVVKIMGERSFSA